MTDFTKLSLSELLAETEAIAADAQQSFGLLNARQLNWKSAAEAWSIAQCLEHLLNANAPMLQAIDATMMRAKPVCFFERLPVLSRLFGKLMIKVVSPGFKQKLKAPPNARPAASAIDAQIVHRFLTHQRDIADRINRLEQVGRAQAIMTSPFVAWIAYSLLDACRLIIAHERRHLAQAQRVLNAPGYPAGDGLAESGQCSARANSSAHQ